MTYTIYAQAGFACPFCKKAEDLLIAKALPYRMESLPRDELIEVANAAGMGTVPIIYLNGVLIGGFTHLEASFL